MAATGARWATAGAVVAVSGLVAAASIWMINNAPDTSQEAADKVPGVVEIASLPFSACYAIPRDSRGEIMTKDGVYPIGCDEEHDGQVLAQVSLENLDWAGDVAMKASAQNQCSSTFNRYRSLFADPEALIPGYFLPNQNQWQKGNRTITCTVTKDVPFTGPVFSQA